MALVIVESSSKAKTIQKYLNAAAELKSIGPFKVVASLGHVVDLPLKELAVDTKTWAVTYQPLKAKEKTIKALRDAVKQADRVFLASDPDREGESIARHLQTLLKLPPNTPRLQFHEITPRALVQAVLKPSAIDEKLVAAQETRRILDRVVGYELSPLLWRRFATSSLSAGRVQSAALKLLVDVAMKQDAHVPEPFWVLNGTFHADESEPFETRAYTGDSLATWDDEASARALLQRIEKNNKKTTWHASYEKKATTKSPPAPFTTSSLQQEAYARFSFPAKRTMQLAQALYEAGHITYMRTDSMTLSNDAQSQIIAYIKEEFGDEWQMARTYKTRAQNAQEAHEAVRPTDARANQVPVTEAITSAHAKLYKLIWQRAVASQMVPATYLNITVKVTSTPNQPAQMHFHGTHSLLTFPGYLRVYAPDQKPDKAALAKWDAAHTAPIPVSPIAFKAEGDVTRPPSQYNEPQLVKALEKHGIGRPSTFATIIDKLLAKNYVLKGANPQTTHDVNHYTLVVKSGDARAVTQESAAILVGGKETDRMVPTSLGKRVTEYLNSITPSMLDTKFTATMEEDLDRIARGDVKEKTVLNAFYKDFHPDVEKALAEARAQAEKNKKEPKIAKAKVKAEMPAKPTNALREFEKLGAYVVQTKYGLALLHVPTKKFVSLPSFIAWRNTTIQDLSAKDVKFLLALPLPRPDGSSIALGRYGLYVKDAQGKNQRLPRPEWDAIYEEFA